MDWSFWGLFLPAFNPVTFVGWLLLFLGIVGFLIGLFILGFVPDLQRRWIGGSIVAILGGLALVFGLSFLTRLLSTSEGVVLMVAVVIVGLAAFTIFGNSTKNKYKGGM
jgi:hypothetical protein